MLDHDLHSTHGLISQSRAYERLGESCGDYRAVGNRPQRRALGQNEIVPVVTIDVGIHALTPEGELVPIAVLELEGQIVVEVIGNAGHSPEWASEDRHHPVSRPRVVAPVGPARLKSRAVWLSTLAREREHGLWREVVAPRS